MNYLDIIKKEISLMKRVWLRARKPDPIEVNRLTRVTYLLISVVGGLGVLVSLLSGWIDYVVQVVKK